MNHLGQLLVGRSIKNECHTEEEGDNFWTSSFYFEEERVVEELNET